MTAPTDLLDRPLAVGDYVVSYNNVYEVLSLGKVNGIGKGQVRIKLIEPSKTTRSKVTYSGEMCKLDAHDVVTWKLLKGY